jgi:hypothetical protein
MPLTKDFWLLGLRAGWHAANYGFAPASLRLQTLPARPTMTNADGTLGGKVRRRDHRR